MDGDHSSTVLLPITHHCGTRYGVAHGPAYTLLIGINAFKTRVLSLAFAHDITSGNRLGSHSSSPSTCTPHSSQPSHLRLIRLRSPSARRESELARRDRRMLGGITMGKGVSGRGKVGSPWWMGLVEVLRCEERYASSRLPNGGQHVRQRHAARYRSGVAADEGSQS
jgi:hypothetical protein